MSFGVQNTTTESYILDSILNLICFTMPVCMLEGMIWIVVQCNEIISLATVFFSYYNRVNILIKLVLVS
jgi:hypothetical protein